MLTRACQVSLPFDQTPSSFDIQIIPRIFLDKVITSENGKIERIDLHVLTPNFLPGFPPSPGPERVDWLGFSLAPVLHHQAPPLENIIATQEDSCVGRINHLP
jgi:hypothetical protein